MKRILFKISGELLKRQGQALSQEGLYHIIEALAFFQSQGLSIGVVIGGGNLFRGADLDKKIFRQAAADQIGMVSTLINGLALQEAAFSLGHRLRLFSSFSCPAVAEEISLNKIHQALDAGEMVLFSGGTGNPFFSTDSAAALRAGEMEADLLVKVTQVDGIYDRDPKEGSAKKFSKLTYKEYIDRQLKVMDLSAVVLCMNRSIPILVISKEIWGMKKLDEILSEGLGSIIT
jgi:uridylate kinase